MKTRRKIKKFSYFILILNNFLLILFVLIKAENPVNNNDDNNNNNNNNNNNIYNNVNGNDGGGDGIFDKTEKILSRRRRYLIFPVGTSLQLVADSHHPIIDYDNLFFVGITLAMAWELPSEPTYISQDIHELYESGQLASLLNKKDENVTNLNYTNSSPTSSANTNNNNNNKLNYYNNRDSYYNNRDSYYDNGDSYYDNKDINYYAKDKYYNKDIQYYRNNHYYKSNSYNNRIRPPSSTSNKFDYYFNSADNLLKQINTLPSTKYKPWASTTDWQKLSNRLTERLENQPYNKYYKTNAYHHYNNKKHAVLPMFGKRSTDSKQLTKEEHFHLKHHRQTRYELYRKIEKLLKRKGKDGHECILRSLCETGQRRNDNKPGSFIVEIMRAIFSLPTNIQNSDNNNNNNPNPKHKMYDIAHDLNENCSIKFPNCKDSIWAPGFAI